jgi:hypothetical protein
VQYHETIPLVHTLLISLINLAVNASNHVYPVLLCSSRKNRLRSSVGLVDELICRAFYNTTGDRQLGTKASEERVNIASTLAAFIDTPEELSINGACVRY